MFPFLEALSKTTLLYRSDPAAGKAELASLLLAGSALLAACRWPLGFPLSTTVILVLLGHGILMIAGMVFLVRGGQDAVQDSMKLSRLLLVTWTVTLGLFVHNFYEPWRFLKELPSWTRALVYAVVATALIAIHTINQQRPGKRAPVSDDWNGIEAGRPMPWMEVAGGWVVLTAVMAVCLNLFVISESFSEQIERILPLQDDLAWPF